LQPGQQRRPPCLAEANGRGQVIEHVLEHSTRRRGRARVLREGGSVWILNNYFRDNPHCHQWGPIFKTPAHLHSAEEWRAMLQDAGFIHVAHEFIPDPTPAESYTGRWFQDVAQLRAFRQFGALLVHGTKSTA